MAAEMASFSMNRTNSSSSSSSSRVAPVDDDFLRTIHEHEQVIEINEPGLLSCDVDYQAELNPQDKWLPITESRKGSTFSATVHLLCSGIGLQALLLPIAFISLGWLWGIICLSILYLWQLYTIWLLVNLHESSPKTNSRYSRFLHLSIVAFGPKTGMLVGIFPTLYLSSGACIFYTNAGGTTMRMLYQLMCDNDSDCKQNPLNGVEWFLVFICLAILIAMFFPNLDSLSPVMFIGSITAISFCTILWVVSIMYSDNNDRVSNEVPTMDHARFYNVMTGVAVMALAFRGHNLVLEIQGTLPMNPKVRSVKPMWKAVTISYALIAACLFPLAIVGHWAYGNEVTINGGILTAFTKFQQNHISKYIIGAIHLIVIMNYLCAFQIYSMVTFDNFERLLYVTKNNKPCPRLIRSGIKVLVGAVIYFSAVALPFIPRLATLIGSIALPLTLVYPCFMWLSIKKPLRFSRMWCLNLGLGALGIVLSIVLFVGGVWNLIVNHFHANFFNP